MLYYHQRYGVDYDDYDNECDHASQNEKGADESEDEIIEEEEHCSGSSNSRGGHPSFQESALRKELEQTKKKAAEDRQARLKLEKEMQELKAMMQRPRLEPSTPIFSGSSPVVETPSSIGTVLSGSSSVTDGVASFRYNQMYALHRQLSAHDQLASANKEIDLLRAAIWGSGGN